MTAAPPVDRAAARRWCKLRVCLFLDGKARQGVAFRARSADRDAREPLPHRSGRVHRHRRSLQLRRRPPCLAGRQLAGHITSRGTRPSPRRTAGRGGSPCQPSLVAAPHVWLPLS